MEESVLSKKFSRSAFMKMAGAVTAVGAGSSLSRCGPSVPHRVKGEEKFVRSVCMQCVGGCGIEVRVLGDRAVKVDGNPDHPVNEGGLCPRGANSLQVLYDPDRIKGPMKRTNPKKGLDEDPGFVEITWDEALNLAAEHFKKLKAEGQGHTVGCMNGRLRGSSGTVAGNFIRLLGSPNMIGHGTICAESSKTSKYYTDGKKIYNAYDFDNAKYIISFGAGFLESWRPTTALIKSWGRMHRGSANRAKFVNVDVRVSVTSNKADEYMLVKPGTDGALALGMVHAILTEGTWNKEFVGDFRDGENRFVTGATVNAADFNERWTVGLVEWWNNIVKDYTPEKASQDCGVPAATIKRIALEFASTRPGMAVMERGVGTHINGTYSGMVINTLNALNGSFRSKGGITDQDSVPLSSVPGTDAYIDDAAKASLAQYKSIGKFQDVAANHAKGDPYKLTTLFYFYANPYFSTPDVNQVQRDLKDVYQIDFSPFMSESVIYSDLVLPSRTFMEMHQEDPVSSHAGYPSVATSGIRQPVVEPLYNTMQCEDAIIEIGKRMGGRMAEYFELLGSYENILEIRVKGLGITLEEWRRKGVYVRRPYPYEYKNGEFYRDGQRLSEAEVKSEIFPTPSGKFEFVSNKLREDGYNPYPHFEPSKFHGDAEHDLYFCTYKTIALCEGRGTNQPFLLELYGLHVKQGWSNWVEIHPETAKSRGIRDGDDVWVESKVSKVKTRAKVTTLAQPDVVNMPHGLGRRAYGRWAENESSRDGVYVNQIIYRQSDHFSGLASFNDTKVKVYKA